MNAKSPGGTRHRSWWQRFRRYSRLCETNGFIPRPSLRLQKFGKWLTRTWSFIQVGETRVVGAHNLERPGRFIYCPNHSSLLDAIVMYPLMPYGIHYMAAVEEMRGLFGLKQIIMGAMGCFPVDRSKGREVIVPAIKLLASGRRLTIYPEGKISPSGKYLPFKKGAGWITIGAYEELDKQERVGVIPIHICYHTRHEDSALSFLKMLLRWRKGVTVTIGDPIYLDEIEPLTPDRVIELLHEDITSQSCSTTSLANDEASLSQ